MRPEHGAMRAHALAMEIVKEILNADDETVWDFIKALPYSEIPDATNALDVLTWLKKRGCLQQKEEKE